MTLIAAVAKTNSVFDFCYIIDSNEPQPNLPVRSTFIGLDHEADGLLGL